jgi:hypothetical protein
MPKIVYHGTLSNAAPHEHGYPFHAGTYKAANDRLDDEIEHGVDWDPEGTGKAQVGIGQIHSYEVSDDAPTSKRVWGDPDVGFQRATWERDGDDGPPTPEVPEHKQNRIYPYKNDREDKGSTSYVVPSSFVGNHVKHLNTQQFLINADANSEKSFMGSISAMVGGRFNH